MTRAVSEGRLSSRVRKAIERARAEGARPADYASVRAKPLAKPKRYDPLTREVELELIRRYHEHGDEEALEQLVGAHRPMVVRMAKNMWRGTTPLKALVEYGMLGCGLLPSRHAQQDQEGQDGWLRCQQRQAVQHLRSSRSQERDARWQSSGYMVSGSANLKSCQTNLSIRQRRPSRSGTARGWW